MKTMMMLSHAYDRKSVGVGVVVAMQVPLHGCCAEARGSKADAKARSSNAAAAQRHEAPRHMQRHEAQRPLRKGTRLKGMSLNLLGDDDVRDEIPDQSLLHEVEIDLDLGGKVRKNR